MAQVAAPTNSKSARTETVIISPPKFVISPPKFVRTAPKMVDGHLLAFLAFAR